MKRDYESRLEALYTEYYGNGGCQFFRECEKGISNSCMFRFDKAKVGAKYGEKTEIPKIVFVGLEGLNGHQGIERTETDKCYNPHYMLSCKKDEGTAPGTAGRSHTSVYTVHGCDPQVTGEERESKSIGYQ